MKKTKKQIPFSSKAFLYIGIAVGLAPSLIILFQIEQLNWLLYGPVNRNMGGMLLGLVSGISIGSYVYVSAPKEDAKGLAIGTVLLAFILTNALMYASFIVSIYLYRPLSS